MAHNLAWRLVGVVLLLTGSALAFGAAIAAFLMQGTMVLALALGALLLMLSGGIVNHLAVRASKGPALDPASRRRIVRKAIGIVLIVIGVSFSIALTLDVIQRSRSADASAARPLGTGLRVMQPGSQVPALPNDLGGRVEIIFLESGEPAVHLAFDEASRRALTGLQGGPWALTKDGATLVLFEDPASIASMDGGAIPQASVMEAKALLTRLGTDTVR